MLEPLLPKDEAQRLAALRSLQILDTPPEERFDRITRIATRLFDVPIALVSLIDANRQWFKSCQGLTVSETPRTISFCGHAILGDDVFVVPDAHLDPRFSDNPLVTGQPYIRFYAGCPLTGPNNGKLGTLCLVDRRPRQMSDADLKALKDLAIWAQNELNAVELNQAFTISENLLKMIFETTLECIKLVAADGSLLNINPAGLAMIEADSLHQVVGRSVYPLVVPENRQAFKKLTEDACRGKSGMLVYEIVGLKGTRRWLETQAVPFRVGKGGITAVLGVTRDITERKRAEETLRVKTDQLQAITDAMMAFLQSGNWQEASAALLSNALRQTASEYGFVGVVVEGPVLRILSHEGTKWNPTVNRGFYENMMKTYHEKGFLEFTNLNNLFGRVITTGQAVVANDPASDPRSGGIPPGHPPLRHFLGVPIFKKTEVVGMIGVANRPGGYTGDEQDKIEILTRAAGVLYDSYRRMQWEAAMEAEYKQAEETIRHLAYYDSLTDLPNRTLLHDHLQQAILAGQRENKPVALLLIDLDRFKEINDTLGHQRGDVLLQQVGSRLQGALRPSDIVARLGGDEFAVMLPLAGSEDAALVADKILKALEPPFMIEGLPVIVEASIGLALYPDHGANAESLMQRADVAMYTAKQTGNGYVIYDAKIDQYSPRRLVLMAELRQAIEGDQLFLHYQPKIDLQTGRVIGTEALARWKHAEYGFIPPDQFIPPAERTGLIKPFTLWVFKTAQHQCMAWHRTGMKLPVSINLSARNLHDPQLPDQLAELLQASGGRPDQVELEITESAIMVDPVRALEVIKHLRAMGMGFSIDDFGAGYSSLTYLKKLPVNGIKIDKSFVINMTQNQNDAVIVRSIIDLGHNLGLNVIAEGVENKETYRRLVDLGCDVAQGDYMCRPISADEFTRWLRESPFIPPPFN